MNDKIILTGIEAYGHHGCTEEERCAGSFLKADLEIFSDLSKAGKSDNLDDTIDYSKILFDVKKIIEGTPRRLIETVAEEIAEKILNDFDKVERVKVVLHKPNAPLPLKYADAAVSIVREKAK